MAEVVRTYYRRRRKNTEKDVDGTTTKEIEEEVFIQHMEGLKEGMIATEMVYGHIRRILRTEKNVDGTTRKKETEEEVAHGGSKQEDMTAAEVVRAQKEKTRGTCRGKNIGSGTTGKEKKTEEEIVLHGGFEGGHSSG